MKFHVYTNEIRDALKIVTKCADPKPQTPILAAVKIDAADGKLTLTANKFSVAAQVYLPVNCESTGSVAVNAKLLNEVIGKFKDDVTTFDDASGFLGVQSGSTNFNLRTFEVKDFPTPNFDCDGFAEVRANFFRSLLRQSSFAVAKEGENPVFRGVNLTVTDSTITAVATNSHRVVRNMIHRSYNGAVQFTAIVPVDSAKFLETALPDDFEVKAQLGSDGKSLVAKFANVAFRTRLIEGEFPPVDDLINVEKPIVTRFNVAEFRDALNRVNVISRTDTYGTVTLALQEDKIIIRSRNDDMGDVETIVEATAADDTDFVTAFNGAYLLDLLSVTDATKMDAHFADKLDPATFTVPDNADFVYIVTPVRT